ncbi:MAG: ABC transporter substrate-binding protein [Desulfitobacteriia bacterium]|jgi:branched-chain amino acid transport system substrate-binding protein
MKDLKKNVFFVLVLVILIAAGCTKASLQPDSKEVVEIIKIGGNFELSGNIGEFGRQGENGARLAIKQINAQGGVLGKKLAFISRDNRSEVEEVQRVGEELINQDGVVAIIGPMTNKNSLASVSLAQENKIPVITPTGVSPKITLGAEGLNEWMFRACFVDSYQGKMAARFASNSLNAKTAAVVFDPQNEYSQSLKESFQAEFETLGGQIAMIETYQGGVDKDFKGILKAIKAKKPDLIYLPGYYNEAGLFIKQAREAQFEGPILGGDGWATGPILNVAGQEALYNSFYLDHFAFDDPAISDFVGDYLAEYNEPATTFSALGYDAALILIAALKKAQSTDPEKIKWALENLTDVQGVSGEITIHPSTHNPLKSVPVITFKDGAKVFHTKIGLN